MTEVRAKKKMKGGRPSALSSHHIDCPTCYPSTGHTIQLHQLRREPDPQGRRLYASANCLQCGHHWDSKRKVPLPPAWATLHGVPWTELAKRTPTEARAAEELASSVEPEPEPPEPEDEVEPTPAGIPWNEVI